METVNKPIIISKESPKQIMDEDFKSHNWPMSGGWGYTQQEAVIINLDRTAEGIDFEHQFIEYRNYEELIIFRLLEERCAGIRWTEKRQSLVCGDNGKKYDVIHFSVSAFRESDWELLAREWNENGFFAEDPEGRVKHLLKRESLKITYESECWFDITNFYGK